MGHKYPSERKLARRDEERAAQPETTPHRAPKDRKRWCRGKVGVEHTVEIRTAVRRGWQQDGTCGWWPYSTDPRRRWWVCSHQEVCTSCGRIMRHSLGPDCPARARERAASQV